MASVIPAFILTFQFITEEVLHDTNSSWSHILQPRIWTTQAVSCSSCGCDLREIVLHFIHCIKTTLIQAYIMRKLPHWCMTWYIPKS